MEHIQDLNPEQQRASEHFNGPILVLAGAGSGKTRVLISRICRLIVEHKVRPENILAVTFTNKACDEMRHRLEKILGDSANQVWVSTFHSAGLKILRRHAQLLNYKSNFAIYDQDDSDALIKQVLKDLNLDEKKFRIYRSFIDKAKNENLLPDDIFENITAKKNSYEYQSAEIYQNYQRALMQANAMDFGDLLVNCVRLFEEFPEILRLYQKNVHYLLVDEFQDTNKVQYLFLKQLSALHKNVFAVGDDDQSIYAFRGANINNILDFKHDFPKTYVVKLEQNYRSTKNILKAAHAVIVHNKSRMDKELWTENPEGPPLEMICAEDEIEEGNIIASLIKQKLEQGFELRDVAIFYRTNAQSRAIEEALMHAAIPYRIYGALRFYDRKEIKDILAYLRLLINHDDKQAFLRIINVPARGLGAQAVEKIRSFADENHISLFEACRSLIHADPKKFKKLNDFIQMLLELRTEINKYSLSSLTQKIIKDSGYGPKLEELGGDEAESRLENLKELVVIAEQTKDQNKTTEENLREFIDRASLSSSAELPVQESKDKLQSATRPNYVTLMTLHLAKGLEFPIVFLTGAEEGLLPHSRSLDEVGGIEEERRLCYVGITRAMKELFLTRTYTRGMASAGGGFGASGYYRMPSRFIYDIPKECLNNLIGNFLGGPYSEPLYEVE